ncbi:hypothetical protein ACJX0J_009452, partial [Zea mays]
EVQDNQMCNLSIVIYAMVMIMTREWIWQGHKQKEYCEECDDTYYFITQESLLYIRCFLGHLIRYMSNTAAVKPTLLNSWDQNYSEIIR